MCGDQKKKSLNIKETKIIKITSLNSQLQGSNYQTTDFEYLWMQMLKCNVIDTDVPNNPVYCNIYSDVCLIF